MLEDPEDVARGFAEAWGRGDADAIAALFADDADFVNVVGFWWTRREQIRHNHAYGFEHIFPGSTMIIERLRVRDLGDTAVVHAAWRIEGQRAPQVAVGEAGRTGERRGIFTFVVHRQEGGGWLAVAAQNTTSSLEHRLSWPTGRASSPRVTTDTARLGRRRSCDPLTLATVAPDE